MKVSQITLWWAELKVWNGCKNPAIAHRRVKNDVEKQWMKSLQWGKNNNNNKNRHHKNLLEVLPTKNHRWEFCWVYKRRLLTKMITEVLYLILFLIWWRFRHVIKAMTDVENILNDEFFGDTVDTSKEAIEQHRKRESLKSVIRKGKA